jgi:hypothetical protein
MDLSSNWGMFGALRVTALGFGYDASDSLSISSFLFKAHKISKNTQKGLLIQFNVF